VGTGGGQSQWCNRLLEVVETRGSRSSFWKERNERKVAGMSVRRAAVLISVVAVVVAMFASAALAKTVNGNDDNNTLIGTDKRDAISGFGGDDVIRGYDRTDVMIGGLGDDRLVGGRGNDASDAVDGSGRDFVVCGSGFDKVKADKGDIVSIDCEDVQRVEDTTTPPEEDADCSDGLDNDGDGKTDFPDDPGCSSAGDTSEVDDGGGTDPPGGGDDVTICHKPDEPAEKETIKVNQGALQGHLGHGDTLGECDDD
jgi:Ca2+-binding RTX toxin-like protein